MMVQRRHCTSTPLAPGAFRRFHLAEEKDIPGILEVQKGRLLSNQKQASAADLRRGGFLIYPATADCLGKLIPSKDCLLFVAKNNDDVIGYALTCDLNSLRACKPDWDTRTEAPSAFCRLFKSEKTLYIRHIACSKHFNGVGGGLMSALLETAKSMGYSLAIAEILWKPIQNLASTSFFEKNGFGKAGIVNDGYLTWNLYLKTLGGGTHEVGA